MSKRRRKKSHRPKASERASAIVETIETSAAESSEPEVAALAPAEPHAAEESTPEPMTVTAAEASESPPSDRASEETRVESVASIDTSVRGRSDSLEPVAFHALEIEHAGEHAEEEDANRRPVPRPPSRFVPMVKTVVATCSAIALLAVVRVGVARSHAWHAPPSTHAAAAAPPAPPPGADLPAPPEEEAMVVSADENVSDVDPALAITLAKRAQQKLETRQVDDAIELGEQAVSHDAKNANAWIVLGAAYQQKGDLSSAKRCYKMCVAGTAVPGDKSREDCANLLQK